jgi:hypothetical protein
MKEASVAWELGGAPKRIMGGRGPGPGTPFEFGDVVGTKTGQEVVPTKPIAIAGLQKCT